MVKQSHVKIYENEKKTVFVMGIVRANIEGGQIFILWGANGAKIFSQKIMNLRFFNKNKTILCKNFFFNKIFVYFYL